MTNKTRKAVTRNARLVCIQILTFFPVLQVQVLVTGSLHLIGGILNLIEPDLWKRKKSAQQISEERKVIQTYNEIQNEKMADKNGPLKLSERS